MKTRKAYLFLAALIAGPTAFADKVQLSQTPPAVQQAIRARAGAQSIEDIDRETRNGKVTYEASWKNPAGAQQELLVSENGAILRDVAGGKKGKRVFSSDSAQANAAVSIAGFTNAQTAPLNWASETTQNKLRTLANGAAVENFQKGSFQGQTAYKASYKLNGKAVTIVIDESGNVLASNPASIAAAAKTSPATSTAMLQNAQNAPLNWASESVQSQFRQMANGASIESFQKGRYQGQNAFQATFNQNGQSRSVIIGEDGRVLSSTAGTAIGAPGTSVTGSGTSR